MAASESWAMAAEGVTTVSAAELAVDVVAVGRLAQLSQGVEQHEKDGLTTSIELFVATSGTLLGGGACCSADAGHECLEHLRGRRVRPIPNDLTVG